MNWRQGGHRLIRVLAAIYIALSAVVVLAAYNGSKEQTVWPTKYQTQAIGPHGGNLAAWAFSQSEAEQLTAQFVKEHPKGAPWITYSDNVIYAEPEPRHVPNPNGAAGQATTAALISAAGFAVLWALYRAARWVILGFADTNRPPPRAD